MDVFSPAQIAGYVSFALGIFGFLQASDRKLRVFTAAQGLVYALHFLLLGNAPACATALISSTRSFLSLRYRSLALAGAIVAVNVAAGALLAKSAAGWLPVIASSAATVAIFTLNGIALRTVLMGSTLLWLANNALSGSIGGTLLELTIAGANLSTIFRLKKTGEAEQEA